MKKQMKWKRNIRLYYTFRIFCTMNFVMPIFMLFLIDKGLSSFEIFVTQAVYTATELILTIPSGAFADKVGRKRTLILSTVLYALGFVSYGYSSTFVHILLAEIVFAVSSAAFHGTGEAFIYDTLAEAKQEKRYKRALGTAYALQSFVMGACSVAGGLMAKHSLALPYLVSALPISLSMVPLFFLEEPRRDKQESTAYLDMIKEAMVFTVQHKKLRNLMYFGAATTLTGFMAFLLYQPMLTGMGLPVEYLGVAIMTLSVAHGIGNKLAHRFEKKLGHLDLLAISAGFRALLYLLVFLARGPYLLVWAILIDLTAGITSPIFSEWMNRYSKSENRATVLSIMSMSGMLSFTVFSPLFGLFIDVYSEQLCYLLLAMIIGMYALRQLAVALFARRAAAAG
ncbi:MAG: MFS transporter [Candidatus Woesearchaeota archaeon]